MWASSVLMALSTCTLTQRPNERPVDPGRCLFTLENVVLTPGWDSYGGRHSSLPSLRLMSSFEGSFLSDLPIFSPTDDGSLAWATARTSSPTHPLALTTTLISTVGLRGPSEETPSNYALCRTHTHNLCVQQNITSCKASVHAW